MKTATQIEDVMNNFDFIKTRRAMEALDWKWISLESGTRTPSVEELRVCVRRLLDEVAKGLNKTNEYVVATGGFEARGWREGLETGFQLRFIVADWDSWQ